MKLDKVFRLPNQGMTVTLDFTEKELAEWTSGKLPEKQLERLKNILSHSADAFHAADSL
jgi:hypothetical protein